MAENYDDLKGEIQLFLDNNNENVVASIPVFIQDAEKRFNRLLELPEQECHTAALLTPPLSECSLPAGEFEIPHDLASLKAVYRDSTYLRIYYLRTIPALSDTNQTNWLLQKYPDLYRYQALVSAEAFLKDDKRIKMWKATVDEILVEVENLNQSERFGGSALRSQVNVPSERYSRSPERVQLQVLPLWDFVELPSSGWASLSDQYYCIAGDKIRIWPIPEKST